MFNRKSLKLFLPILLLFALVMMAFYAKDLLKYGNRIKYPISEIVDVIFYIIMGISVFLGLLIIDIYLSNYLQEIEIRKLEKELKTHKKGVD